MTYTVSSGTLNPTQLNFCLCSYNFYNCYLGFVFYPVAVWFGSQDANQVIGFEDRPQNDL